MWSSSSFSTRIYLFIYSFLLSRSQTATKCGPRPPSPLVFICLFIPSFFLGLRRQRSVVLALLLHSYLFVYLFVPSVSVSDGNEDKAFTVQPNHGSILLAQPVDCETRSSYNLTLSVTDGVHKDFTWVSRLIIQSATLCYSGTVGMPTLAVGWFV